jgi:glutamate synthase domain-containing protein 3
MMRKCHLNTCPVGVATQDPELRKRFTGKPDYVERFLRFVAQDFRERMAELGFRTVDEMVGRSDLLEFPPDLNHPKARMLDFGKLLGSGGHAYCTTEQDHGLERSLDHELKRLAEAALERGEPVRIEVPVRNVNRAVGAMLSGEIAKRYGLQGLPDDTIRISLKGSAGQSLGAFLSRGVTIRVQGDANDYLGKGLSGGRIIVVPPADAAFAPHENIVAGNVVLYGATSGQLFCNGVAGERFAVRNSGAEAVVEGVGDHGCEYMTGGTVVILGPTGYNFAAGMSGGVAYVYNDTGLFDTRCNLDMVDLEVVNRPADQERLRSLIETHIQHTGSPRASAILQSWERSLPLFVKVMPIDYRRSLERMRLEEDVDRETLSATEEVFSA